jgi:hypothetical protein
MAAPTKDVAQLTNFLKQRGSPLAAHVNSIYDSANRYRVDPRLIVAIAGGETSFGKAGRGPSVFNAWGIGPGRSYGSWAEGIDGAAKLLRENYIGKGLTSLPAIQQKWAPLGAGNDPRGLNSNWTRVNGQFYSELGGDIRDVTKGWRGGASPRQLQGKAIPANPTSGMDIAGMKAVRPDYTPVRNAGLQNLMKIASGETLDPLDMLGGFAGAQAEVRAKYLADQTAARVQLEQSGEMEAASQAHAANRKSKSFTPTTTKMRKGLLIPGTSWKGTHVTDGLDWNHGQKTAVDIMARAGTQVGAPEAGTIIRHGSAQGGQALYFKADSGHLYWMGHLDDLGPVGEHFDRGARIALISADHPAPHLHIDRKR